MEKLTVESFYAWGKKGSLLGLRCSAGHVTVPPRHSCRVCESPTLEVVTLSGKGTIASFTKVYSKSKEFPLETPYTLALVTLKEGGNLLGIVKDQAKAAFGLKVRVKFETLDSSARINVERERLRIFFEIDD
ncbi:MAG: Zn-ribbon domain-containing OB-fold protein [Nitrososphaerales archaeon]